MSANHKHFSFPNSDASKAEEIAFITNLAEDVQPGTYLADLFTKNFVSWVVEQIRNDFTPDLMGALENQHVLNSQAELRCAAAVHEVDKTRNEYAEVVTVLRGNYDVAVAEIHALKNRIEFLEDQNQALSNSRIEALRETQQLRLDLANAEQKIIDLKVRLFDLMDLGK